MNSIEVFKAYYDNGRLKTAYGDKSKTRDFYKFLLGVDERTGLANHKKYFTGKSEIFINALLIGFFYNRKSKETANDSFIRARTLPNEFHDAIIKMVFFELCERPENVDKDDKEMLIEICSYADGGIEFLMDHYNKNNKLDMKTILEEIKPKMHEMAEKIKSRANSDVESDQ